MHAYWLFLIALTIYSAGLGWLLVWSVQRGKWWLGAMAAVLVSPVAQGLLGTLWEHRSLSDIFNPTIGSWLFIFGHGIALPAIAAASAIGWHRLELRGKHWYTSWYWYGISLGIGVAVAVWYRGPQIVQFAAGNAFDAPTKLAHDLGDLPMFVASLLCVSLPVIVHACMRRAGHTLRVSAAMIIITFAAWFALRIYDDSHYINPKDLHPGWDWQELRVVPLER